MIEELIVKNCDKSLELYVGDTPKEKLKTMSKEKKQSLFNKWFGVK